MSARTSGTGLGLAIALDIDRSHGGDITLGDSRAGAGEHFPLSGPWRRGSAPSGAARRTGQAVSKNRRMSSVGRLVWVFSRMCFAWVRTVAQLISSRAAAGKSPLPVMISARTRVSAGVSPNLAAKRSVQMDTRHARAALEPRASPASGAFFLGLPKLLSLQRRTGRSGVGSDLQRSSNG